MVRKLALLALCLILVTSCAERSHWDRACAYLGNIYSCKGIPEPKIEYRKMRPGLLGYYRGKDTLYISDALTDDRLKIVVFHEMIHYLQVQTGRLTLPGNAEPVCRAEEEAFQITDVYREILGMTRIGDYWWRNYPYCWRYYAPKGSRVLVLDLPHSDDLIIFIQ